MKKYTQVIIVLLLLAMISSWIYVFQTGQVPWLDIVTRDVAEQFHKTRFYGFFRFMTELGSKTFLIPFTVVCMVILIILNRSLVQAFIYSFGTLCTWFFNHSVKGIFKRERPSIMEAADATGYSFPSGHAMISFVSYGLLAYFLSKHVKTKRKKQLVFISAFLLVLLIGLSRYFINVHYLTDIIAGYTFGFIFLNIWIIIYKKLSKKDIKM